jgi:enolase
MPAIKSLDSWEILDSRGHPTLAVACELASGARAVASVPSGASTGISEARELRDLDRQRYGGRGCLKAANNVRQVIEPAIRDRNLESQSELDNFLLEIDGTSNKHRIGANAILGTSVSFARAVAIERNIPLFEYFASLIGREPQHLPRLTINLFSGGKHAGGQISVQDMLIAPRRSTTIAESLSTAFDVYQAAIAYVRRQFGTRPLVADEGGLAPDFSKPEAMFDAAIESIRQARREPGIDVMLAVDVAASHFHKEEHYYLENTPLTSEEMIERISRWTAQYPLLSVEDGLAEDDWDNWPRLLTGVAGRARVLGDDLLCTNPQRIARAVAAGAANALLLKVNQIGTLTEAAEALAIAREAGWSVTISARSGETEDDWLADLAVGWGGDQIKVGSIVRSERLAKYNRLLKIERDTGLPLAPWPSLSPR